MTIRHSNVNSSLSPRWSISIKTPLIIPTDPTSHFTATHSLTTTSKSDPSYSTIATNRAISNHPILGSNSLLLFQTEKFPHFLT